MARYLDSYHGTIHAPWWAHLATQEYLSRKVARFTSITPATVGSEGLFLIHKKLSLPDGEEFRSFAKRCSPLRDFGPTYEVRYCRAP